MLGLASAGDGTGIDGCLFQGIHRSGRAAPARLAIPSARPMTGPQNQKTLRGEPRLQALLAGS
jgi:hypothetical protein